MFNSSRLRISVDLARNERQRVFYQLEQIRVGEIGAGKVLTGLAKRIDREIEALAVGQPAEVEGVLRALTA